METQSSSAPEPDLSHHKQREYCTSRLRYRDGRMLTAVKVLFRALLSFSTAEFSFVCLGLFNCERKQALTGVWRAAHQPQARSQAIIR